LLYASPDISKRNNDSEESGYFVWQMVVAEFESGTRQRLPPPAPFFSVAPAGSEACGYFTQNKHNTTGCYSSRRFFSDYMTSAPIRHQAARRVGGA